MALAVPLEIPPMEARLAEAIPDGAGWQFEPKWDGFRCLAFRDGDTVELRSKSGKPLGRYFPEIVEALGALEEPRFVLDGELVLPEGETPGGRDAVVRGAANAAPPGRLAGRDACPRNPGATDAVRLLAARREGLVRAAACRPAARA